MFQKQAMRLALFSSMLGQEREGGLRREEERNVMRSRAIYCLLPRSREQTERNRVEQDGT